VVKTNLWLNAQFSDQRWSTLQLHCDAENTSRHRVWCHVLRASTWPRPRAWWRRMLTMTAAHAPAEYGCKGFRSAISL